ncbi:hypothetical protein [Streptomyces albicerus]|nr:hypothetical protein [Streptomyces albicerus]
MTETYVDACAVLEADARARRCTAAVLVTALEAQGASADGQPVGP